MADMTISRFLVAILVVGLFASLFSLFFFYGASLYGQSYDNTSLAKFQKLQEISSVQANATVQLKSSPSAFDILGAIFNQGYIAAQSTYDATIAFTDMTVELSTNTNNPLGQATSYIFGYLTAIVLVLITVGIFLRWIIKDRT